ncbi:MAG: methylenetetrahydrofolate--tRNA-(uracil(54)-C(5))-methyltransferase (FADH(2)-oxidizing) TrmFO [Synergistales bacterium]|nr:methylenetetrahydrofolate--tRNA-(uracil(54)-C(5))-methyltransferase (FADH(2)-oxidizing) TrmFO [Synergistales bacterium]
MNSHKDIPVSVIGGGLAGAEASWQLARRGFLVDLYEMRPHRMTPAHSSAFLAELVCSNSLGADGITSPAGILKDELRKMDSLIMQCADGAKVAAGRALAVDRQIFADMVTDRISSLPNIRLIREEMTEVPEGPAIIATGPLTSPSMAESLAGLIGEGFLYFFDAVSPVLTLESVNMEKAFWGSRYEKGDDYLNCPMDKESYLAFWDQLVKAQRAPRHELDRDIRYFEGCLPVEEIASRGVDTLRFGPMKPVGLPDPSTGKEAYGVVQLRRDNREGSLFNMVGFQTSLKWGEQDRVFRMIPALENAEFVRYGVMHRNIYVNAPRVLKSSLELVSRQGIYLAGQITGVEGYVESTATGLMAAINLASSLKGLPEPLWPRESALGSLSFYLQDAEPDSFKPMNVNLGIFPPLGKRIRHRLEKCRMVSERAEGAMKEFLDSHPVFQELDFRQ